MFDPFTPHIAEVAPITQSVSFGDVLFVFLGYVSNDESVSDDDDSVELLVEAKLSCFGIYSDVILCPLLV